MARLTLIPGEPPKVDGDAGADFMELWSSTLKDGAEGLVGGGSGNEHILFAARVPANDLLFPFALMQHFRKHGYTVEELRPEVDAEITELLKKIDGHEEIKKQLLDALEDATNLEKTFVLQELEETFKR